MTNTSTLQNNSEFSKSLRDIPQIPTLNYDELNTTSQVSKSKEIEDR